MALYPAYSGILALLVRAKLFLFISCFLFIGIKLAGQAWTEVYYQSFYPSPTTQTPASYFSGWSGTFFTTSGGADPSPDKSIRALTFFSTSYLAYQVSLDPEYEYYFSYNFNASASGKVIQFKYNTSAGYTGTAVGDPVSVPNVSLTGTWPIVESDVISGLSGTYYLIVAAGTGNSASGSTYVYMDEFRLYRRPAANSVVEFTASNILLDEGAQTQICVSISEAPLAGKSVTVDFKYLYPLGIVSAEDMAAPHFEGFEPVTLTFPSGQTNNQCFTLDADTGVPEGGINQYTLEIQDISPILVMGPDSILNLVINKDEGRYSISENHAASSGICDGYLRIQVDPDNEPHTYVWSNGDSTNAAIGLCPGVYAVTVTDVYGCERTLSAEIIGTSGCYLPTLNITADIEDFCGPAPDGSIVITNPDTISYDFDWSNGASGLSLSNLTAGQYCVTVTNINDSNCTDTKCFNVQSNPQCANNTWGQLLMVSEMSNGPDSVKEYIELLVLGNGSCDPVDLRGYIIDDNNGDFTVSNNYGSSGVSSGHVRFRSIPQWSGIKPGARILIYNPDQKNASISLEDDPSDSDGDNVYVLPLYYEWFEGNAVYPSTSNPYFYPSGISYSTPSWDYITFQDSRDAVQVRNPDGSYCHGFSYGTSTYMTGGPQDLQITTNSAAAKACWFNDGNAGDAANYESGNVSEGKETPGQANSTLNAAFTSDITCSASGAGNGLVIINEFSNGPSGAGKEYVELLVIGKKTDCSPVDLRHYIIDDNNGDFSSDSLELIGTGISAGHIRFVYDTAWSAVPPGSLILIYNPADKNASITQSDDPYDSNSDGVYILPANHPLLEGTPYNPSITAPYSYGIGQVLKYSSWTNIWETISMNNSGDAIQIRNPSGTYCHGISYGGYQRGSGMSGGPDSLLINVFGGDEKVYYFNDGSYRNSDDFGIGAVAADETPGEPNNTDNENYIAQLCGGLARGNLTETADQPDLNQIVIFPNPFSDVINIRFHNPDNGRVNIFLFDFTGRKIMEQPFDLAPGPNLISLDLKDRITQGVYFLSGYSGAEMIFGRKVISIK